MRHPPGGGRAIARFTQPTEKFIFCSNVVAKVEEETLEPVTAAPRVLVSYDAAARRRTACSMVQQFLFGRRVTVRTQGGEKRYRYEGLVHRAGVERLGEAGWGVGGGAAGGGARRLGRL